MILFNIVSFNLYWERFVMRTDTSVIIEQRHEIYREHLIVFP